MRHSRDSRHGHHSHHSRHHEHHHERFMQRDTDPLFSEERASTRDAFAGMPRGAAFPDRFSWHALWHAIGRHRGDSGGRSGGGRGGFGGGFGGPFGGGGFGGGDGEGFARGRKFSSDDLQLLLLGLLDTQPSHGYELIKALETRSNGFYSPSPGMVYPALTYLEELGYVTVQLEGNRKRYELAEPGRKHLADNRERVELMLAKLTHIARKMDSVRRALAGEDPLDPNEGGWLPELIEARRALKHALLRRDNVPVAEQRRIAAILARATAEIEGTAPDQQPGKDKGEGKDANTSGGDSV